MLPFALLGAARAACPATASDFSSEIVQAESSFEQMRVDAFAEAWRTLEASVACASERVDPATAARIHRLEGLRAWLVHDDAGASAAFSAARAADPTLSWAESLAPRGHPVRVLFDAATVGATSRQPLPAPVAGTLLMDGTASTSRPGLWPTVAQYQDEHAAIAASAYLRHGDAMFAYPLPPPAPPPAAPTRRPFRASWPIAAGALAGAAAAGVTWGLAKSSWNEFHDPGTPAADLAELRSRTNGLWGASLGAASVAVGLGVTAVVVGRW
jgi:hypothetical protein